MFVVAVLVFVFVSALTGEALPVVVFVDGQVPFGPDSVLSYKSDSVSGPAQQHRISPGKCVRSEMSSEVYDAVPAGPLAGKDTGPAGCAYRGGNKGILKPYTVSRQGVHIRGPDNWITGTAHSVGPLVVGH